MQKTKALKFGVIICVILVASFSSVMYALAYSVKKEVIYTASFQIDGKEQKFRAFHLSAPAVLFEVKLSVSKGTIKWSPYSAELFDATFDAFHSQVNEATYGTVNGWECETDNGAVNWRIDSENLDQVWYLCFLNDDSYEKTISVEVTKVWSEQNYLDWT